MGDTGWEKIKISGGTDNHYCKHNTLHHTCHAPLPKIRGNGDATKVSDVYT